MHTIRVTGSQYDEDYIHEIVVTLDEREFILKPYFEKKRSSVNVYSNPSESVVFLDGTFQGTSPVEINNVEWGKHEIKVKREGFHTYKNKFNLNQDDPLAISSSLKPLSKGKAIFLSFILPGTGQFYTGGKKKGAFLTLLNSGLVSGAIYSRMFLYKDARDRYLNDKFAYDQATTIDEFDRTRSAMQNSFNHANSRKNLSNGLTIGAAVIYLYTLYDTFTSFPSVRLDKYSSANELEVKFDSALKGDGVSVDVQYTF